MKKNTAIKLICIILPVTFYTTCFSQSASALASAVTHNSASLFPDTARKMVAVAAVNKPVDNTATGNIAIANSTPNEKYITLQRTNKLDTNRQPMMAIPIAGAGQASDKNLPAASDTIGPK